MIKPNITENTINIMEKVKEENKSTDLDEVNIGTIDSDITDLEVKNDANIFKLYGLTNKEMNVIFQSLNISFSYQQLVSKH